jgi:hypothetical protein
MKRATFPSSRAHTENLQAAVRCAAAAKTVAAIVRVAVISHTVGWSKPCNKLALHIMSGARPFMHTSVNTHTSVTVVMHTSVNTRRITVRVLNYSTTFAHRPLCHPGVTCQRTHRGSVRTAAVFTVTNVDTLAGDSWGKLGGLQAWLGVWKSITSTNCPSDSCPFRSSPLFTMVPLYLPLKLATSATQQLHSSPSSKRHLSFQSSCPCSSACLSPPPGCRVPLDLPTSTT